MSKKLTVIQQNANLVFNLIEDLAWDKIAWENFTPEVLRQKDDTLGETMLHKAAYLGCLEKIPKTLLTEELLLQKTIKGESVYLYASKSNALDIIPKKLWTKSALITCSDKKQCPLDIIISRKEISKISKELLEEGLLLSYSNFLKTTYLHYCAYMGILGMLPDSCYNNHINYKDKEGNTLLHWAAKGKEISKISLGKHILKWMEVKNHRGETPLHLAENLNTLPKEVLINDFLKVQNKDGDTPLHITTYLHNTKYLPMEGLDISLLLKENIKGETPISNILEDLQDTDKPCIKKILMALNKKQLINIRNSSYNKEAIRLLDGQLQLMKLKEELVENQEVTI